jgi:hypothetical protein
MRLRQAPFFIVPQKLSLNKILKQILELIFGDLGYSSIELFMESYHFQEKEKEK